jgi:hypothetical protein
LLMFAILCGVPICWVGLFFFYRKKPRSGIIFWLVNPAVAVIWAACFLVIFASGLGTHCAAQTPFATTIPSSPSTLLDSDGSGNSHQTEWKLDFPKPWSVESDGHAWVAASEADKQSLAAAFSAASSQKHTSLYFYTNLNELYDSPKHDLGTPVSLIFGALDRISPAKSYPTFQGFSWVRKGAKKLAQGDVMVVFIFWPDGSGSIHFQKLGSALAPNSVSDDPWEGDVATYKCTTTVSGSNYTMNVTAPETETESGLFQVSLDGRELEMVGPGRTPIRYSLLAKLADNRTDAQVESMGEKLKFPNPWSAESDGHTWQAASEADKQALAAAFYSASSQQHTAAFFYTNMNEQYDHAEMLHYSVASMFAALEQISPAKSYPTFLGYIWQRMGQAQTPQGPAEVFGVYWPDGHSFIHYQNAQNKNFQLGGDGPWPGDLVTYTSTIVLSGKNYTILTTAPPPGNWTDTGTFQVSADGKELEMARPGHIPIRYTRVSRLANSIEDANSLQQQSP